MKTYEELKTAIDTLFDLCEEFTASHPWLVCIVMHELARNTYPNDPFIPFSEKKSATERLHDVILNLIQFIKFGSLLGSYRFSPKNVEHTEVKKSTGEIYGKLWSKFTPNQLSEKATRILAERLQKNGISTAIIAGKKAVDVGCGSGRFSLALKNLGASSVIGVDYGDCGLEIGRRTALEIGLHGVEFKKEDILNLSFPNETFDFTFSNGVIHHSESMENALKELFRITKPGGHIWLYIYADGGIFWYARKRMPLIMQSIPQDYTIRILDDLGMPSDRFIFTDNWYVPIETHTSLEKSIQMLKKFCPQEIIRLEYGRDTDLDYHSIHGSEDDKIMYGDGELRFIIKK
mgnify:CR=1 FL=1